MLFISRLLCDNILHPDDEDARRRYGVVDTDDGVEQIVEWVSISIACCKYGLDIKGVTGYYTKSNVYKIDKIEPYQPSETMTPLQAKTAVLNHVSIKTYKDEITSIEWLPANIKAPVTIRLSDFGRSMSDFCLRFREYATSYVVTLVLDDNIRFRDQSFSIAEPFFVSAEGLGVKYDIRELTSNVKASIVYNSVGGVAPLDAIIDKPERMAHMKEKFKSWR